VKTIFVAAVMAASLFAAAGTAWARSEMVQCGTAWTEAEAPLTSSEPNGVSWEVWDFAF
jgi:hypothetical protein